MDAPGWRLPVRDGADRAPLSDLAATLLAELYGLRRRTISQRPRARGPRPRSAPPDLPDLPALTPPCAVPNRRTSQAGDPEDQAARGERPFRAGVLVGRCEIVPRARKPYIRRARRGQVGQVGRAGPSVLGHGHRHPRRVHVAVEEPAAGVIKPRHGARTQPYGAGASGHQGFPTPPTSRVRPAAGRVVLAESAHGPVVRPSSSRSIS